MENRNFPIIGHREDFNSWRGQDPNYGFDALRTVPWSFLEPFEEQAKRNYDQDLITLARRGGLDPIEIYSIVNGIDMRGMLKMMRSKEITPKSAMEWLKARLSSYSTST